MRPWAYNHHWMVTVGGFEIYYWKGELAELGYEELGSLSTIDKQIGDRRDSYFI